MTYFCILYLFYFFGEMQMNINDVKLGTRLDFELINSLGEKIGQSYVSQLVEVVDNEHILIACPIHESRLMLILPGTRTRMLFLHVMHGLISFTGAISGKEKRDNLLLLRVKMEGTFERLQRRKYFRLDCFLNASYRILPEEMQGEDTPKEQSVVKKTISRNLSGNGAGIVTEEELPKGTRLETEIKLTESSTIKVICKVVRCILMEGVKGKKYDIGLYFTHVSAKDQELLIKFIFDQQRLLLKKGK
jgi:c-di-GMP-binding flagellar brake protein YcgR